ncbi:MULTISPECIES: hypothetical protein [unclassified Rhizobium]|uniref:hypothetical protein n=1 Tax=unclassified Rhizobium TaxID=2613769 RepID=UPI001ADC9A66|nr:MULTISPECIES: hypothetical protein [unclassified Rhizobium]MBO9098988.1 hypothetical protein [Rhizobium sp. L58/93]MBO9132205.1 hypothetical protein [Rhizobium sp. B209b/85]MBO9169252.1 hypothetical protein [Rhizobium sp. L245/93]MBO9185203.1 hypothetical protein [Rhizobium sp. E27B/91]QXZ85354.1 hypothetical protein J5287_07535 [Rhizobium sp. K1/93]
MRILIVPFAAAAIFAMANYSASAMNDSQANSLKSFDQAVMAWQMAHHPATQTKASTNR